MGDLISRQAAIDIINTYAVPIHGYIGTPNDSEVFAYARGLLLSIERNMKALPSAQPEHRFDEWCTECKEYDHDRHCCPRFNQVIRTTLQEVLEEQKKGKWVPAKDGIDGHVKCNQCYKTYDYDSEAQYYNFCPNCGADMRKQKLQYGDEDTSQGGLMSAT